MRCCQINCNAAENSDREEDLSVAGVACYMQEIDFFLYIVEFTDILININHINTSILIHINHINAYIFINVLICWGSR